MQSFVLPIGHVESSEVYGEGEWPKMAQTLSFYVMIGRYF